MKGLGRGRWRPDARDINLRKKTPPVRREGGVAQGSDRRAGKCRTELEEA